MSNDTMSRADHLTWSKKRALELVDVDPIQAHASLISDLSKHSELRGHIGIEIGNMELVAGTMRTPQQIRHWIEGFN